MKPLALITNIILFLLMVVIAIYGVRADDTIPAQVNPQYYAENDQTPKPKPSPPYYSHSSSNYSADQIQQMPSHADQSLRKAVMLRDKKIQLLERKIVVLEKRIRDLETQLEQ